MISVLDFYAEDQLFEANPRAIVGMLTYCSPSGKWVPGGITGGEEWNWPHYLTMLKVQSNYPV